MSRFKLLAIVPMKGCDVKFTKNLKIGEVYKFYQGYDITYNEKENKIEYNEKSKPENEVELYNLKNGINLNISAVVGLNGSGKSSLIELLYYFIYKTVTTQSFGEGNQIGKRSKFLDKYRSTYNKNMNIPLDPKNVLEASKIQNKYGSLIHDLTNSEWKSLSETDFIKRIKDLITERSKYWFKEFQDAKRIDYLILRYLNVGLVYETESGIFSAVFDRGKFKHDCLTGSEETNPKEKPTNFDYKNFFYTISLNFSHHSLNSKTLGSWIDSLFHKNDAYTTPVVINPMRNEGNFNVNREIKLNNERLMSTVTYSLARTGQIKLLEKYQVTEFFFRTKKKIIPIFCEGLEQRNVEMQKLNKDLKRATSEYKTTLSKDEFYRLPSVKLILSYLGIKEFEFDFPFLNYAIGYLNKKIPKIKNTYPQLIKPTKDTDQTKDTEEINASEFINFLKNDKSHVTKKIRQTLNFLKVVYDNSNTIWENPTSSSSNHVTVEDFKKWLEQNNKNYKDLSSLELMEFALPGFFSIDYELLSMDEKSLKLSELSSGEQQMLFNINTIVYHLLNLQSVHKKKSNDKRVAYKNVAVILDEIELYYHPEMQRKLVKNIIDALEIVKKKCEKGIESINICFLTHSPFILSDIPSSNILKLDIDKEGKSIPQKNNSETFGANIHDLLANDFFLTQFMGDFAEKYIKDLVDEIKSLSGTLLNEELYESFISKVRIIAEPVLRNSIKSILDKQFEEILVLKHRQEELKIELDNIQKKLKKDGAN